MSNSWRRFEVLLPLRFNDGREVPSDWLADAVYEFGAARFETQKVEGHWRQAGIAKMVHRSFTKPRKGTARKSNRQRRKEFDATRISKRAKEAERLARKIAKARAKELEGKLLVNTSLLNRTGSYNTPKFVERGYYLDEPSACVDCGKADVWTAAQQKWWYEIAKGDVWKTARRCLPCRRRLRAWKKESQRIAEVGRARRAARPRLPKSSKQHLGR
jgi:hypothetical protein